MSRRASQVIATIVFACVAIAAPAQADLHNHVLDVLRSAQYIAAQTQEARISEGLSQKARDVQDALELAIATLQNNPIRRGAIDVGVVAGGGLDVDRGGADAAAKLSAHLDGDRC